MKKIVFMLIFSFFCLSAVAQSPSTELPPNRRGTHLKFNGLFWMVGVPNVSVETRVHKLMTIQGEVLYSPWESILGGNKMKIFQFSPEFRVYPWGAFNKLYVGAYVAYHDFEMTKWNYFNTGKYEDGYGWAAGFTIGCQLPISNRWTMDAYVGGGFQDSGYKGYNADGTQYVGWNYSGEWLPYKLGIAFSYAL